MDEKDMRETDKRMSQRITAIFSDPKRHTFYSCFVAYVDNKITGPRGGTLIGRKKECWHCGGPETPHATETESL